MQAELFKSSSADFSSEVFAARVEANQARLRAELRRSYDFIVCGSGSSGSVVARRLAENPDVSVLLLEAGGTDALPTIEDASRWTENLGTAHDWAFKTRPNPHLNGRSLMWSMGKVLGGSSSINAMMWSRGHKSDWDYFAQESGDQRWSYRSVLDIYRRIEDWQGPPDPERRGTGGPLIIEQPPEHSFVTALFDGARSQGIPSFADQNGAMMEGDGGAAVANRRIQNGKRLSIFRSYSYPHMDRPNLTVLTHALVTRVRMNGTRATGVEVVHDGKLVSIDVGRELILSLGAIQTPKVLMQSGIGDARELGKFGIDVVQHLPGVGRHLEEHLLVGACLWEYSEPRDADPFLGTFFCKSDAGLDEPDLQGMIFHRPFLSPDVACSEAVDACCSMIPCVVRPHSKGRVHLTGPEPGDPVDIDANLLSDPADLKAAIRGVELCRDIGNSAAFRSLTKREVLPGRLGKADMEAFVRNAVIPYWHYTSTARMGRDEMAVVDATLRVRGIEGLRIADGSIMPRVATGNTMAPCVIIGEQAAAMIRETHGM